MKIKTLLTPTIIALGLTAVPFGAQAAVFAPFASFSNGYFTFTNVPAPPATVAGATFVTQVSAPQPVNFVFDYNVSHLGTNYTAGIAINNVTVTMSATDRGPASTTPIPGGLTFLNQPVQDVTSLGGVALKFTDSHGYNLLTVSNFTGNVFGFAGNSTANLASDTNATPSNQLTFSSDFLTFAPGPGGIGQGNDSIGLTLTNGSTLAYNAGDGLLNSFTAVGDGTFSSVVAAPEPSGIVSLAVLMGCLTLCAVRRKAFTA